MGLCRDCVDDFMECEAEPVFDEDFYGERIVVTCEDYRPRGKKRIKDSGFRKEFDTGAVRDTPDGKGRCDLMPLSEMGVLFSSKMVLAVLYPLESFQRTGCKQDLRSAIEGAVALMYKGDMATAMLETAKQYEDGAKKYADRNWEKGIPFHCYVDSAVRHFLKWLRGDNDEPHDRAVLWNLLSLLWSVEAVPEMDDLPYSQGDAECGTTEI